MSHYILLRGLHFAYVSSASIAFCSADCEATFFSSMESNGRRLCGPQPHKSNHSVLRVIRKLTQIFLVSVL